MKLLIAIAALLAASSAHAEIYICEREARTGLMMFDKSDSFSVVDFEADKKETFVVTRATDHKLTFAYTTGETIHTCTASSTERERIILCNSKMFSFWLDTSIGKYVETNTSTVDISGFSNAPFPILEGGKCDLFKQ